MVRATHGPNAIGTRIKLYRTAAGMSQPQLAVAIDQAARRASLAAKRKITVPGWASLKTQISLWENGHRAVSDFYWPLIADALNVPQAELFPPPAPTVTPLDEAAEELRHRILTAGAIDAGTVDLLNAQTHQLRLMDRQLGGREVLGQLRSHVQTVQGLLSHAILPAQRAPLAAILADAAALAGWQALDTGAPSEAWQHHETAKAAAREAGSSAHLAHAMGQQAYALLDLGRPTDALALVHAAQKLDGGSIPPLLTCWLMAATAELSAASGDADRCRRALELADHTLPSDYADPELPYLLLAPAHLARWRGSALSRLGDSDAIALLYAALDGMGTSSTLRAEAGLRVDLVAALSASGAEDEARSEAAAASELAIRAGSVRLRRRLDRFAA